MRNRPALTASDVQPATCFISSAAKTAAVTRRPTKFWEDRVKERPVFLKFPDNLPIQGRFRRGGALVALALVVAAAPPAPARAAETPLRMIVFPGVQNLPIYAAQAKGFFARRELRVDLTFTPNSMALREGLAKGTYDLAHTAVDNAIAMVELAKVDVVVLMGGDSSLNGLYVQPDIQSVAELRGRTVAVVGGVALRRPC